MPGQSTKSVSELKLVLRVANRDEAAVIELYRSYADAVFRYVYPRVGRNYEDAEEITQDVFGTALSLAATFDGKSTIYTWLYGIARLRVVDFYRKHGREKRIPSKKLVSLDDEALAALEVSDAGACEEKVLDRIDAGLLVDAIMASLNAAEREALLLRFVNEFSIREVAGLMNRTEKAIEQLISRARKKAASAASGSLKTALREVQREANPMGD